MYNVQPTQPVVELNVTTPLHNHILSSPVSSVIPASFLSPALASASSSASSTSSSTSSSSSSLLPPSVKHVSNRIDVETFQVQRRAQFILKLHSIVSSQNVFDIIRWSNDGQTFTIKQPDVFAAKLLSKICSHTTFASFERQIHFYS